MRDKSTCVSVRSVQTCEDDIDVQIGMRYCMEFSVVAKFSSMFAFSSNYHKFFKLSKFLNVLCF